METIKERLKLVKKERNITSNDVLGKYAGITRQSVGAWFKATEGSDPSSESIMAICDKLNYNYDWLMHGIGPKEPKKYEEPNKPATVVNEDSGTLMSVRSVLESYYKEIDLIKEMLTLKQESYGKVIFPQGK